MTNYSITTKYRSGVDKDGDRRPWNEIEDCGSFRSTVDFTVTDQDKKTDEVNGIIVQYIQKSTTVDIYKTKGGGIKDTLNTSEEISEYTNNNVKYMNDHYLEYFKIKNGKSMDGDQIIGDQFGNGPICKYSKKDIPKIDDELDMSEGTIIQNGYAIYIPYPQAQNVKDEYDWDDNEELPANGLPMLTFNEDIWTELFNMKQSIVYAHKVSYKWTYLNIIKQARKVIYLDSCEEDESAFESAFESAPDPNEEAEEEDDKDDDDLAAAMAMSLGLSANPATKADEEQEITSTYPISKTKPTRESAKPVEPLESKEPQEKQKGGRRKTRRKKTKKKHKKSHRRCRH